ncbi:MAG: DUF6702 family protein [Bacteroidota bacterium]
MSSLLTAHNFHLSKSMVEYNAEEKTLEITLHIFLDDLEATLFEGGIKENLNLCTEKEHPKGNEIVAAYLKSRFRVMVNGELRTCKFIGKEISEDFSAAWCYLEVEGVSSIENIGVQNTVLMELFEDQRNIVQIKGPDKKPKSFIFDRKYIEDFVEYK